MDFLSMWVIHTDSYDLPVSFSFIDKSDNSKGLHLNNFTKCPNLKT